jgi:hypothetical protein
VVSLFFVVVKRLVKWHTCRHLFLPGNQNQTQPRDLLLGSLFKCSYSSMGTSGPGASVCLEELRTTCIACVSGRSAALFAECLEDGQQINCEYELGPVGGVGNATDCCTSGCKTCVNGTYVAVATTCSPNIPGDNCTDSSTPGTSFQLCSYVPTSCIVVKQAFSMKCIAEVMETVSPVSQCARRGSRSTACMALARWVQWAVPQTAVQAAA